MNEDSGLSQAVKDMLIRGFESFSQANRQIALIDEVFHRL
jgi:hypothetical protein